MSTTELDWGSRRRRWNLIAGVALVIGLGALTGSAILFLLLSGVFGDIEGKSGPGTVPGFGNLDVKQLVPQPTPEATSTPPSEAAIARLSIPRFEVDAPVVVRGIDANKVMVAPDGPTDVAWYDFSARPGFGSNAVFAGHVDYINYGPAVFWNLKDLNQGDEIRVQLADGTAYRYRVFAKQEVPAGTNVAGIVGATEREIITLITCGGTFNYTTGQYESRLVVRAARIFEDEEIPPGA